MALIGYQVKDEQRGKVSKETVVQRQWGSEIQRLFFSKVYREDWPAWGIEKLVVSSTSPRQSESEDYGL